MTDGDQSSLSVVVVTRDRPGSLDAVLARLRPQLRPGDELIVVDAQSDRVGAREVAERYDAQYLWSPMTGVARARNEGWRRARRDLIAFLDDDVVVGERWVGAIVDAFTEGVGVVTGSVGDVRPESRGVVHEPPHGVNLAVRRSALTAVRGFDQRLGAGTPFSMADDLDLRHRIRRAGFLEVACPLAGAVHAPWGDRLDLLAEDLAYGKGVGAWVAKLLRTDRRAARAVAVDELWRHGVGEAITYVRRRWGLASLRAVLRTCGLVAGFLAAVPHRVYGEHFAPAPLSDYGRVPPEERV